MLADNSGVRLFNKILHRRRMPVIAARHPALIIQALLHNRPFTVRGDNETMQINLKAIADRIVVDRAVKLADAQDAFTVKAASDKQSISVHSVCYAENLPQPPQT